MPDHFQPILDLLDILIKERCRHYEPINASIFHEDYKWREVRRELIKSWETVHGVTDYNFATTRALIELRDQTTWDRYYSDMND